MTPVHLSRFSLYSNQVLHLSKPANSFAMLALTIKSVAIIIIPLIAAFFIYILFSDPTGVNLKEPREVYFNNLKLSPSHKNNIKFIIENLAIKSKPTLLMMSSKLNAQGNEINDVHPLKFISYVLSDKKMKNDYLPLILKDKFKKMSFMKGLTKKLEKMDDEDLLKPYLIDFMKSARIPLSKKDELTSLIDENKWHDFFSFAIENSKNASFLF